MTLEETQCKHNNACPQSELIDLPRSLTIADEIIVLSSGIHMSSYKRQTLVFHHLCVFVCVLINEQSLVIKIHQSHQFSFPQSLSSNLSAHKGFNESQLE